MPTDLTPIPPPDDDGAAPPEAEFGSLPITPDEADAIAESRGEVIYHCSTCHEMFDDEHNLVMHRSMVHTSGPTIPPAPPPFPMGPFAKGDVIRLKAAPGVTGTIDDWDSATGEWGVKWAPPHARLDPHRLVDELEHVPPPGLTKGERVWIPGVVTEGEPDPDGELEIMVDPELRGRTSGGGDFVYILPDQAGRLLRPHAT